MDDLDCMDEKDQKYENDDEKNENVEKE